MQVSLMIAASFLLMALSYAIARKKGSGQPLRWAVALATIVVLVLAGFFVVADYFSGVGVDESVIYHLRYGLAGAGFGEYPVLIAASIAFVVLSLGIALQAFRRLSLRPGRPPKRWRFACVACMLAAVGISPASTDMAGLYAQRWAGANSGAQFEYIRPVVEPVQSPPNLVFIYLESFERTYLDEQLFPGLTPGLKKLEKDSLSYTNVRQVYGAGWTVAGMTASQCGIPLVTAAAGNEAVGNSMSGMEEFLPGALCIGDILAGQGYTLDYMGGASLNFAGKGDFYRTHGFQRVQGLHELKASLEDPAYRSSWGLHDDTVFDLALDRFSKLAAADRPFGLFLLTLGTHHPRGHLSAQCEGLEYGTGKNPILNAVHCSDRLVAAFVEALRSSGKAENTFIVIASDHLAMRNTASGKLDKGDRKNLLLVIPPGQSEPALIGRAASTLDIAPTLLSMMGFDVEGLGLGRDLAGDRPTVVEALPEADAFLASQAAYLATLWEFPQLDQGVLVDAVQREARLGESVVKVPALFVLGDDLEVKEILFEFHTRTKLVDHLAGMSPSQSFMWIDSCARIDLVDTQDQVSGAGKGLCLAAGRLGAKNLHARELGGTVFLDKPALEKLVTGEMDPAAYSVRIARLERHGRPGRVAVAPADPARVSVFPGSGMGGDLVVQVSGGPGPSFIGNTGNVSESNGLVLSRGLTLFGMDGSTPIKLAHYDSCNPDNPVADSAASSAPFRNHLEAKGNGGYSAYVVLGHDSVRCGATRGLERIFAGLPLDGWRDIGFREPYVGVIAAGGKSWEKVGPAGTTMALRLVDFSASAAAKQPD